MKLSSKGLMHRSSKSEEKNLKANCLTQERIAALAYRIYEQDGRPEGKAWEHWFNAESMLENNFGYGRSHAEHDFTQDDDLIGRMKILVQRIDTGEFYRGENRWTHWKTNAHDFATRQSAEDFCQCSQLPSCKIVVHLKRGIADLHA